MNHRFAKQKSWSLQSTTNTSTNDKNPYGSNLTHNRTRRLLNNINARSECWKKLKCVALVMILLVSVYLFQSSSTSRVADFEDLSLFGAGLGDVGSVRTNGHKTTIQSDVAVVTENQTPPPVDKKDTSDDGKGPSSQNDVNVSKAETETHNKESVDKKGADTAKKKMTSPSVDKNNTADPEEKNGKKPLNIVLLYADDWSFKTLGALNPFVKTPHIDEMAQNGVLFTHKCVTTSICMVSRATLYTGQYASRHKNYMIEDEVMYEEGVWNSTLFSLLAANGYHNGMVGKWHHFDPPEGTFETFKNYYADHYIERDGKERHVTELNQEDAIEFLDSRPDDKPFALMVSFFATHAEDGTEDQYRPQDRTKHLYANETVPIPRTATEKHFKAMPHFLQNPENFGRGRWEERYSTPELYQTMMKKTYRMATEVDTACGVIMEKLKEQKLLDSTIVIFTTDNGNLHGEHGLAEKWYPYEESIRVPLVVMDPRMPKEVHNTRNDEFILNIDLAPTLLQAAKIDVPEVMQGRDFAPLYTVSTEGEEKLKKPWRKEFYYEWFTGHEVHIPSSLALVRKDWKYILWPEYDTEELFELRADPDEERNIFKQHTTGILIEMKKRFLELKESAEKGSKL